jgi:hypothetical protein
VDDVVVPLTEVHIGQQTHFPVSNQCARDTKDSISVHHTLNIAILGDKKTWPAESGVIGIGRQGQNVNCLESYGSEATDG